MPPRDAPTAELGSPGQVSAGWGLADLWEETAELRFPLSVAVFDRMRRTDGQVASILRAITLPIRRTGWSLSGDDVRPEVTRAVELELGLAGEQEGLRRRRRQGIVFDELLRHALLMLPLGFMPLEQVYEVGPGYPGTGREGQDTAHLRKLAPRMPRTIAAVLVADDGGLEGIRQTVFRDGRYREVLIPVDRLVYFCHEREGADWLGTSILRAAYKHWLIKDNLLRIGPIAVERNGMGLPVVYYPQGGDRALALDIARKARAGEEAGVALPDSYRLELLGVTGSTRDELDLVKYHDQAMSRSALAMFLDLGHDNGARALGDTFVDVFTMACDAVADTVATTVTEHVIRDFVELNYGADEPYPTLVADTIEPSNPVTAEALQALAGAGLITPDGDLEDDLRRRWDLPGRDPLVDGGPFPGPIAVEEVEVPSFAELEDRVRQAQVRLAALRGAP